MDNAGAVETFIDLAETRQMLCSVDRSTTDTTTDTTTATTATNTTADTAAVDITDKQC